MKILHVDHQILFREGLRHLLDELDETLELLATGSLSEALALLAGQPGIDLILLDIATPGMGGCEGLRVLHSACPSIPLVALSGSERTGDIHNAMNAGAAGYIPKSSTSRPWTPGSPHRISHRFSSITSSWDRSWLMFTATS